jgi:type II secretory pathway component PulF
MATVLGRLTQPFRFVGRFVLSRPLSTVMLLEFARSIRFFLSSGMTLRDGMRVLAERGTPRIRRVARNIGKELAAGWSFQAALEHQGRKFNSLFQALATVGEETGRLPEVMKDLENYYEMRRKQQAQLRAQAMLPILQFIAAVTVVAGLVYIMGQLPQQVVAGQKKPFDPLGLGLVGAQGAITFVSYVFGTIAAAILTFLVLKMLLRQRAIVERLILFVPILGPCLRDLALTRFSFAMQLMLDSSMSILTTIRLAFRSTDNPAYIAATGRAEAHLKRGNSLLAGLTDSRLFPYSYLSSVAIGEESGHLPEVMRQLAEFHDERAKKGIEWITRILGTTLWLVIAGFVIFLIFSVFQANYIKGIVGAASGGK